MDAPGRNVPKVNTFLRPVKAKCHGIVFFDQSHRYFLDNGTTNILKTVNVYALPETL